MAGEYSRELSVKVHAGQSHFIGLGFRQGGAPGFGLRRMDGDGDRIADLEDGEDLAEIEEAKEARDIIVRFSLELAV